VKVMKVVKMMKMMYLIFRNTSIFMRFGTKNEEENVFSLIQNIHSTFISLTCSLDI
jgi:hypothetical protein